MACSMCALPVGAKVVLNGNDICMKCGSKFPPTPADAIHKGLLFVEREWMHDFERLKKPHCPSCGILWTSARVPCDDGGHWYEVSQVKQEVGNGETAATGL